MKVKSRLTPETCGQKLTLLGPAAWLASMLSIYLDRINNPNLDFIIGFLVGLSITGNLIYIILVTKHVRENWRT